MVFGVVSRWGKYHSLIRISLVRLPGYPVYSVYSIPCCMSCGSGLWVTLLVVHGAVPISKRHQFWYIQRQTRSVCFKKACQAGQFLIVLFYPARFFWEDAFVGHSSDMLKYHEVLRFGCWVATVDKDWQNHLKYRHLRRESTSLESRWAVDVVIQVYTI